MTRSSVNDLLAEARARTTSVLVVRGSTFDAERRTANEVVATVRDNIAIDRLLVALSSELSDASIMSPGDPTIALLSGRAVAAVIQVVGGYIRCPELWEGDARLAEPAGLTQWLDSIRKAP